MSKDHEAWLSELCRLQSDRSVGCSVNCQHAHVKHHGTSAEFNMVHYLWPENICYRYNGIEELCSSHFSVWHGIRDPCPPNSVAFARTGWCSVPISRLDASPGAGLPRALLQVHYYVLVRFSVHIDRPGWCVWRRLGRSTKSMTRSVRSQLRGESRTERS